MQDIYIRQLKSNFMEVEKMRKKLALVAATVALGAFLVVGGTLAWFTASTDATNTISVGGVSLTLKEDLPNTDSTTWQAKKIDSETVKGIEYSNIQPGDEIIKNPTIEYTGKSEGYVRYQILVSGIDVEKYGDKITFVRKAKGDNPAVEIKLNALKTGNDYYYVETPMKEKDEFIIFDQVKFDDSLGNSFAKDFNESGAKFDVKIVVEAIQTANTGKDAEAAFANFPVGESVDKVSMGTTEIK